MLVIEEACQKKVCGNGCRIVTAWKAMAPIEKRLPGPGLFAHVLVSKYRDYLPLHHQETIFQRQRMGASKLVRDAWNGFKIAVRSSQALARSIENLVEHEQLR